MASPPPLHIGIVPYLNMLQVTSGMEELEPGPDGRTLEVTALPPSGLMRAMEAGRVDIGMAPMAGVFEHPEWKIVGRSMIGSRGPVLSVLAISADPSNGCATFTRSTRRAVSAVTSS